MIQINSPNISIKYDDNYEFEYKNKFYKMNILKYM